MRWKLRSEVLSGPTPIGEFSNHSKVIWIRLARLTTLDRLVMSTAYSNMPR
jgi:hypothetical protein